MDERTSGRRPFIFKTCALMAASVVPAIIGAADASAQQPHHEKMMESSGAEGYAAGLDKTVRSL